MRKNKLQGLIIICIFCFILANPVLALVSSNQDDTIRFRNVDVLVLGRCRFFYSSEEEWTGGLFRGYQYFCGFTTTNTTFERFNIIIKNNTNNEITTFRNLDRYHNIEFINTTGIFFVPKHTIFPYFPWFLFVKCHAEKFSISEGPWDD